MRKSKPNVIFNFYTKSKGYIIHPSGSDGECKLIYDMMMHVMSCTLKCDESKLRIKIAKLLQSFVDSTSKNQNLMLVIPFIDNKEITLAEDLLWYIVSTLTLKREVSFFKRMLAENPVWETFLFFRVIKKKKLL